MDFFTSVFIWYFYSFVLGMIFFPVTRKIFSSFFDLGYPFARTIGLIATSYILFILGTLKILPFYRGGIFLVLIICAVFLYYKDKTFLQDWKKLFKFQKFTIVFEEIMFFFSILFLAYIRAYEPSIHGLEKFMDFGFINSILRSNYFPPLDMWLSADPKSPEGYPINYYYFGHLTGAFLIKFSGVSPFIGYNLILATIYAQGITLAFSITANIVYLFQKHILKASSIKTFHLYVFGLIGSYLVNLGGNLHPIYLLTNGYPNDKPTPFWTNILSLQQINTEIFVQNKSLLRALIDLSKYWYPNATRFIPFTIHEFPSYSYVVADLHGHVFDIPFVILTLALMLVFFLNKIISIETKAKKEQLAETTYKKKLKHSEKSQPEVTQPKSFNPAEKITLFVNEILGAFNLPFTFSLTNFELFYAIGFGFMIAIHYMTNAFDGPIYLLFIILTFFTMFQLSVKFFFLVFTVGVSFIVFSLPFSTFFKPFASKIGVNCSPDFIFPKTTGAITAVQQATNDTVKYLGPFIFEKGNCQVSAPWMLLVLWGFFWISAIFLLIVLFSKVKESKKHVNIISQIDVFMLLTFGFGTFLVIVPEFFYAKDIYPAHFRANTMFKMGYQAFIMMSVASAYALYRMKLWNTVYKIIPITIYCVLAIFIFIYPVLAFPSYYPNAFADNKTAEPTLNGLTWMNTSYPEDREIIEYLNKYIKNQPVILEAQGDSYTDYERISANTGLPTVAGWWVHEWLWRGDANVVGERLQDISNMYESKDVQLTKSLLKKYNVSYVIISNQERTKYPNLYAEKYNEIGTKIFESSNRSGALYQVK